MRLNTIAKGRDFEAEVADWLKTQGYNDIERSVRVEVSDGLKFECDVHAHRYSLLWVKLRRLGIILFAVAWFSIPLKLKPVEDVFQGLVAAVDPGLAPNALFIVSIIGFLLGYLGKTRTGHHAWVECKSGQVTRDHVVKLTHVVDQLEKNKRARWIPRRVMIFSGEGFDRGALSFARDNKIHCYRRGGSGFVEIA